MAGSSITQMALPVLAVLHLDATTAQVAWLTFLGQLPPAPLAPHAGALADRYSKHRQMITGDLVSAAVLATRAGGGRAGHADADADADAAHGRRRGAGAASVLHDAAAISLLPSLVDRSLIQRSNSRVGALFAIAASGGSHLGAALTAVLGPARALLGDVTSYLISAGCTARIKAREPARTHPKARRLCEEIGEGLRYVHGDDRLQTLTLVNATTSFALALLNTLWALYLLRTLAMSATAFGVVLGLGALGAAAEALTALALARRYGPGPMMLTALVITPLTQVPLLLASSSPRWQIAVGTALFLQLACAAAAGTTQRSIRQIVTAEGMQARMQAVSTWLTAGARPVAALLAGGLGTWVGVRPTLTAGTFLLLVPLVALALVRSPLPAPRCARCSTCQTGQPPRPAQTAIPCRRRTHCIWPLRPYPRPPARKTTVTTARPEEMPREHGAERRSSDVCRARAIGAPGGHRTQ
ncbi:MFS transporter [Streptomyces sp. NPDC093510]|uniref:MFS transporter n=1 Tax=Streptomyces sp. NPDC093510 TaxID=3155199 RepID=UPI003414B422